MSPSLRVALIGLSAVAWTACQGSLDPWGPGGSAEEPGGPTDSGGPVSFGCPAEGCPDGLECRDGRCLPLDPCEGVRCPGGDEVCSGGICVAGEADNDGDGYPARVDCDDFDPNVHPGAPEVCNGVDDNCDGEIDEGFDEDGDGFTVCGSGSSALADCDDTDPLVFPGAPERCNGRDDNCNGLVDEDVVDAGMPCGGTEGQCRPGRTVCSSGVLSCSGGVGPTPEVCDGLDNDCDGVVDNDIAPRSCSGGCGSGTERCVSGRWVCDAPASGECTPGSSQERDCDCGFSRRTCTSSCTWGSWGACSGGPCGLGTACCGGTCRMDVNNCGGCGLACPSGYRAACCSDGWGGVGCCPDGYPVCGADGYCYAW